MRVRDALGLPSLAAAAVVAGAAGIDRQVRWAHVVDMPQPGPWIERDQLLLTTGFAWPKEAAAQAGQVRELAGRGLAAIGLAVPGYIDAFSPAARSAADSLDLPLLEIPWDVPFARVTEELHRALLSAQRETIERSESIHRALTRAAAESTSLQELAQQLGTLVSRAVTIEDPEGKLLARYDCHDGRAPQAFQAPEPRSTWERIRASVEPLRIAPNPETRIGARVVCPIRIAGELSGAVWILEGDVTLSELDHRAAEHAALVAALQIAHQRELAQLESRLGYASFLSLLEAPDASTAEALERARLGGFDPDVPCRVGIVLLRESLPLSRDAVLRRDRLADRLRRALTHGGVARPVLGPLLNRIPFLLPAQLEPHAFAAALVDVDVRFVFGRGHEGADGLRASYREARSLEPYGDSGRIVVYEEVLLPRVLAGDPTARRALLDQLLGPLEQRRGGAALREALLVYASEGFRFRRTAQRLGIHPNTLRYRLARARETTALDFDDPDVQFRLQLAGRLQDMCGEYSTPGES